MRPRRSNRHPGRAPPLCSAPAFCAALASAEFIRDLTTTWTKRASGKALTSISALYSRSGDPSPYLVIVRFPILSMLYTYFTHAEMMLTPVRNFSFFLYLMTGPLLYLIVRLALRLPIPALGGEGQIRDEGQSALRLAR